MQIVVTYEVSGFDVEDAVKTAVEHGDISLNESDISSIEVS